MVSKTARINSAEPPPDQHVRTPDLTLAQSLDTKGVAINAGIAAATAGVPGLKSAAGALAKQLATKAEKGLIKAATNSAAAKAIGGTAPSDAGAAVVGGIASGVNDRVTEAPAPEAPAPPFSCGTPGTISCGK